MTIPSPHLVPPAQRQLVLVSPHHLQQLYRSSFRPSIAHQPGWLSQRLTISDHFTSSLLEGFRTGGRDSSLKMSLAGWLCPKVTTASAYRQCTTISSPKKLHWILTESSSEPEQTVVPLCLCALTDVVARFRMCALAINVL